MGHIDVTPGDLGGTPVVEVRVYREGALLVSLLCESAEEAADAVEAWSELEGVEVEVDDFSQHHRPGDIAEPEPTEREAGDAYPSGRGPGVERHWD